MLAAARHDFAPMIRHFIPVPDVSRGEPNLPAAICLANRASAYLQLGQADAAVVDARAATLACPEYVKGHFRLRQALIAANSVYEGQLMPGGAPWRQGVVSTPDTIQAEMTRFDALSHQQPPDRYGRRPPGIWLGFRLVVCFWLDPEVYHRVYEDYRARMYRDRAHRVMANQRIGSWPPDSYAYDYRCLRVHMEVFHTEGACPPMTNDYLTIGLNTLPTRPCLLATGEPSSPRMADSIGEMEPPPLPSIDYRHIPLPATLSAALGPDTHAETGRMIATALIDMFVKDDGLRMVTMLGLGYPLHVYNDTIRAHFEAAGLLKPTPGRELDALVVLYTGGSCIKHRKFGYRGVIVGTADHTCMQGERWIMQMGVDDLPRGRYQPWYHVLVDVRDRSPAQMTYVCHENITLWLDPPADGALGPIDHPDVRKAFTAWDPTDRRYVMPGFVHGY